jgi:hypothetical protein
MAEYVHIAIEIPQGEPQIEYFELGDQWTPRGDVLRCVISDGGPNCRFLPAVLTAAHRRMASRGPCVLDCRNPGRRAP